MKAQKLITPIIIISLFTLVGIAAYWSCGNLFWMYR